MNNLLKVTVVLLSLGTALLYGAAVVDITAVVGSSVCTGKKAHCDQTIELTRGGGGGLLNAISGNSFKLDVAQAKDRKDLGIIDKNTDENIELSVNDGGYTVYSFEPKETGKQTFVAFQSSLPGKGRPGQGRVVVSMYRQFKGDKATDWEWRGSFALDRSQLKPEGGKVALPFILDEEGKFQDPKGSQFDIGG